MGAVEVQHFVPRFFLQRFSDSRGRVWVYDKTDARRFPCSPSRVAAEKSFYDLSQFGYPDARALENALSGVESESTKIFACWDSQLARGELSIPPVSRSIIAQFLAIQLLRTREQRLILAEFYEKSFACADVSPKEAADLHIELLWNSDMVNEFSSRLETFVWVVAVNKTKVPYWTSDHPVLLKDQQSKHWILGPHLFDKGVQVIFPLSPTHMLYCMESETWDKACRFDGGVSPVSITDYMVQHENSGQVGMSTRFVFSPDSDYSFADEFCAMHPQIRDPNRERFEISEDDH